MLEQNLQNLLIQKQAFWLELNETEEALKEVEKSGDEIFKVICQLMVKTERSKIKEELSNKKRILDARIKSIEKQENIYTEKIENIREDLIKNSKK